MSTIEDDLLVLRHTNATLVSSVIFEHGDVGGQVSS
jgi:hypothetical protein